MKHIDPAKKITSFHPPQRTLMGPGPSEINPRVLAAMSVPAIGYLDPAFVGMMEELKLLLRYVYQTENPLTFPISGPGSVGMESCFVNMVAPGDKVIVGRNGVFGGRMLGACRSWWKILGASRLTRTRSKRRSRKTAMRALSLSSRRRHPPAANRTRKP